GILGVLFSMIGMDPVTGNTRFTFGRVELLNGIPDVPALIGIFAISEVLLKLEKGQTQMKIEKVTGAIVNLKEYLGCLGVLIKSAIIGTIVGIIPATGGGVASWFAYGEAKRGSKHPERFGTGILEGVAASESANNAVTGGALVPLLTLGVPGDVVTAVLLGALMIQGLTPGPTLFVEKPEVVGGIFASLMVANVFMVILGLAGARGFSYVLRV
ncbi:MAG: tripartite tricarboxylate transporter permease, partial [Clostridia bacterium]|nr:tripartite tricarboxylate transporter permease [Clostridia bacterium]